jgi:hypothetical protein
MAKTKMKAEVASLNPDDMLAGGLKTDFRAVITKAVYCPWDYNGTQPEPVLGVRIEGTELDVDTGEPVETDKPWVDYWSAGSLDAFVPSEDGQSPAEGDEEGTHGEGPYALKMGKRPQMNNNTNFARLMKEILTAGATSKKFSPSDLTSSLECLHGLDAHWDRVPQEQRKGMVARTTDEDEEEGGSKKRKSGGEVLVVTKVYGYGEAVGGKKKKAAAAPVKTKAAAVEDDDDDEDEDSDVDPIDAKLHAIVLEAIEENGKVKRGKLANLVLTAAGKDKDKSKMIGRVGNEEFLAAGPWSYDSDSGILTAAEEE